MSNGRMSSAHKSVKWAWRTTWAPRPEAPLHTKGQRRAAHLRAAPWADTASGRLTPVRSVHQGGRSSDMKEIRIQRYVGVWIDHRKAVIVSLIGEEAETTKIISGMEKHVRFSGGARDSSAEDQRDRRFTGHLHKYYDK